MATKLPDEAAKYTPSLEPVLVLPLTAHVVSLAGAVFDLAIGPLLLSRTTRPLAFVATFAFHVSNHFLWSLGEFPWVMLATNLLFLDKLPWQPPPLCETSMRQKTGGTQGDRGADAAHYSPDFSYSIQRFAGSLLLGLYCLGQLLLPLRPLVVSGFDPLDAVHTKTHTLLSWRMMAVATRNFVNVTLRSEQLGASMVMTRTYNRLHVAYPNGTRLPLPLTPRLEPRQAGYMPYMPHMLLSFARDAARRHGCEVTQSFTSSRTSAPSARTHSSSARRPCVVRGDLWSAINGRPLQRFVEPLTDLATAVIEEHARPPWVKPLLHEFGNSTWRSRIAWL